MTFPKEKKGKYFVESRGLFFEDETKDAHSQIAERAAKIWSEMSGASSASDISNVKSLLRKDLAKFVMQKWDRDPSVVAILT